jgi:hypothetical protein
MVLGFGVWRQNLGFEGVSCVDGGCENFGISLPCFYPRPTDKKKQKSAKKGKRTERKEEENSQSIRQVRHLLVASTLSRRMPERGLDAHSVARR